MDIYKFIDKHSVYKNFSRDKTLKLMD